MNYILNHIVDRHRLYKEAKTRTNITPSYEGDDVYNALVYLTQHSYEPHIACSTVDYLNTDPLYKICISPELRKIIYWIGNNIISNMFKDDYTTRNVKVRIAIGMLNKLEQSGKLCKDESIEIGNNIVVNIQKIHNFIVKWELPF